MRRVMMAAALMAAASCAQKPAEPAAADRPAPPSASASVFPIDSGFVDAHGVLIYYEALGSGTPLVVLHGGPGASHNYFLPYLLPLARTHRVVFIDERGSGKSEKLEDPSGYTVDAMVEDVEAVRQALDLGRIDVMGHSFGGVLAQGYAFKYQANLSHLVLASTFHSTRALNDVFRQMKAHMTPEFRTRLDAMEKAGLYGRGKPWERGRYSGEYMAAAWGEGYFPYLYQRRPDPNYDPASSLDMSWDLYREMWGSHGEFVVDGNLTSVEYADRLPTITVPTLITVGDHDQVAPSVAEDMHKAIKGSTLSVIPQSGHMTFVDQPGLFVKTVADFVANRMIRPVVGQAFRPASRQAKAGLKPCPTRLPYVAILYVPPATVSNSSTVPPGARRCDRRPGGHDRRVTACTR